MNIIKGEDLVMGKVFPKIGDHFRAAAKETQDPALKRDMNNLAAAFTAFGRFVRMGRDNRTLKDEIHMDNARNDIEAITRRTQNNPAMAAVLEGAEKIYSEARKTFKSSAPRPSASP